MDTSIQLLEKVIGVIESLEDAARIRSDLSDVDALTLPQLAKARDALIAQVGLIRNFEVRLAVLGRMKAGKSTFLNSVIGTDILPSRSTAMTALPTIVRHVPHISIPQLSIKADVFNHYVAYISGYIKSQLQPIVSEGDVGDITAMYTQIGQGQIAFKDEYSGHEVIKALQQVNDVVRTMWDVDLKKWLAYCKATCESSLFRRSEIPSYAFHGDEERPIPRKLGQLFEDHCPYTDSPIREFRVPEHLPTVRVTFDSLKASETKTNLALIDLPGLMEGRYPVERILTDTLMYANAGIPILNSEDLQAKMDSSFRSLLHHFLDDLHCFAVLNKRDLMDEEIDLSGMAAKYLESKVSPDRIYCVSAKQAFDSLRILALLEQLPQLWEARDHRLIEFGNQAFGRIQRTWRMHDRDHVEDSAKLLYAESGIKLMLDEAIGQTLKSAGAAPMHHALREASRLSKNLRDAYNFRVACLENPLSELQKEHQRLTDVESDLSKHRENVLQKCEFQGSSAEIAILSKATEFRSELCEILQQHLADRTMWYDTARKYDIKFDKKETAHESNLKNLNKLCCTIMNDFFALDTTKDKLRKFDVMFDRESGRKMKSINKAIDTCIQGLYSKIIRFTPQSDSQKVKIDQNVITTKVRRQGFWARLESSIVYIFTSRQPRSFEATIQGLCKEIEKSFLIVYNGRVDDRLKEFAKCIGEYGEEAVNKIEDLLHNQHNQINNYISDIARQELSMSQIKELEPLISELCDLEGRLDTFYMMRSGTHTAELTDYFGAAYGGSDLYSLSDSDGSALYPVSDSDGSADGLEKTYE
eukprot:TRINITY_DN8529_c0_g1_i2.p1 TRINITY_DN8529_c0_g1~~TRINITY_DN8529_c0_g1_i2.p1  ORF type:complete len:859 (+),score=87.03 TRINITY_DN8529_c0_g1_i2:139-2577(+)